MLSILIKLELNSVIKNRLYIFILASSFISLFPANTSFELKLCYTMQSSIMRVLSKEIPGNNSDAPGFVAMPELVFK